MENEQSITLVMMSDEKLNEKLEHSYQQSLKGDGRPLDEVFDEFERELV